MDSILVGGGGWEIVCVCFGFKKGKKQYAFQKPQKYFSSQLIYEKEKNYREKQNLVSLA